MSLLRSLRRALNSATGGSDALTEARLAEIAARLERVESRLDDLGPNIKAVPALLRRLYLDDLDLPPPYDLTSQRFRVRSQNDEDGLLLAVFRRAGVTDRRCVEIGCGMNGGNTGFLVQECGWTGLMIDANRRAVEAVRRRYTGHALTAHKRRVSLENLNKLLDQYGFTGELDLFSIDVDGIDYWLWDGLTACRPRVLVIEYNWLFGPERAVTVPYDPEFNVRAVATRGYRGASLAALVHLGRVKGYRLVATERVNAVFVRDGVAPSIPAISVARGYRAPANRPSGGGDALSKIEREGLPLVTVAEQGVVT